ncbi:TetR/AcrR family transcriptional regulator [Peribacillus simplex]|uniref:TetR/AcrR family transcriptional regulator n=1 Tax=Peribacillus simplex TaxID=1478 RepID=UPI00298E8E05|nr:TetR/AcrR family transcriptional regulator [Peribacillus simplex]MDW7615948.1 TetR/AcrR family transcriptional regulator [Peribacillus simplex]
MMSPRKSAGKELSREMVLTEARNLFATLGYSNVSMRQLAKSLDCSHGAIYYHFKNKAEIYYSLVKTDFSVLNHLIDDIFMSENDPSQKIEKILLCFIEFGLTQQNHYSIMFLSKEKEIQQLLQFDSNKTYEKLIQSLTELTDNKLNPASIWSIFLSLHGFITFYINSELSYPDVKGLAYFHVKNIINNIV